MAELDDDAVDVAMMDRTLDKAGVLFRSLLTDDASVAEEVIAARRAEGEMK